MAFISISSSKSYVFSLVDTVKQVLPGLFLCVMVATSAVFVSEHYNGPTILYALIFGMALNYLSSEGRCVPGIQFTGKTLLRLGIALLGAKITMDQLSSLGLMPVMIAMSVVPLTIASGYISGRLLKLDTTQSILSGSAVGICGASAALAVSTVLPAREHSEKELVFTVISVTALSTIAMVAYPMIASVLKLNATESGIFLGATIHDVAQVVGAGYMISSDTGDIATFTKLLRVAMLVPVVAIISLVVARQNNRSKGQAAKLTLLPGFLVAFICIMLFNSLGYIPAPGVKWMGEISRWCLIVAMVALGMKASLKELMSVGWRPMVHVVLQTVCLAVFVATWILMAR
ncbi:YeiH family putative sulfate export transporter [Pseudomonas sp. CG7]|uniref:YeiH family protein n=1 Tax=Pseudomonas sp. CG7 TaxID=191007 RepID=UPI0020335642|nr:YeiH family protein [Pseudomonas sp. CG7]MCM2459422.1 YeiH family putative sulfate export transporter [Pseudomonas sp. CG7]